jgi:hypothetical protein
LLATISLALSAAGVLLLVPALLGVPLAFAVCNILQPGPFFSRASGPRREAKVVGPGIL